MRKGILRTLVCIAAVSSLSSAGTIYAENDEDRLITEEAAETAAAEAEEEEGSSSERAKRSESQEKISLSAADAEKYLVKIGSAEGLDIYYKDKDFDDALWEEAGGKPQKKSDYTPEQEALADKIDELKKAGELVAFDRKSGTAAASFKSGSSSGDEKIYISDAKRYIITTDKDTKKVLKLREIVSSLDDPCVFLTDGGKTLDIMSRDLKKVQASYRYSGTENDVSLGKTAVFKNDENDGRAWLSADKKHYFGTFRTAASNDMFDLLVDDRTAVLGIKNRETGYTWWSSPPGASQDTTATPLIAEEILSSSVLRYGVPLNRSNNNVVRSGRADDCECRVSDISGGVRVEYDYKNAGFRFPVEYTLDGDHMKARLDVSQIQESNKANTATEITLLGSMGAASDEEEGYFVIPDGSGALIRFNNNRTMQANAYNQRVYGADVTAVPTSRGAVTEQIYMPVYGIVKKDNAMLVVASEGDANAFLSAKVSKQSNSRYNLCSFTFVLRGTDTFYMSGSNEEFTTFESGKIKSGDVELLYYPISKKDADFTDIAARYRQYLTEDAGVEVKAQAGKAPMYVDLYGGAQKKKPVLGIPVTVKQSVTGFSQAKTILSRLKENGVDDIVVSYNNWTNDGINNKIDTDAKPSGKLGGKSGMRDLRAFLDESGYSFYPSSDNRTFYSGNGFYSFTDTSVRISGSYSRIVSYDRAYGIPDGFKKNMSLLSPSHFSEVFSDAGKNYSKAGLDGIAIGDLTSTLYGDYGKKGISRFRAKNILTGCCGSLADKLPDGILADSANAYVFPYVEHITNVPLTSSRFDIFDEDIPFYQIVMHGVIPYSSTPINADADSETLLLMAAASGSCLSYDMIYEDTSILKDTEYDVLYYANYKNWTDTAAAEYDLMKPVLGKVSGCTITSYRTENDGQLITAEYSDGTVVTVDLEEKTIDVDGQLIMLSEYTEKGGIRF